jgi:transmembrane sensor
MAIQNSPFHGNIPDFVIRFLTQREKFKDYDKVESWIKENRENRKLLDQLADIWQASIVHERLDAYDENNAWQNFRKFLKLSDMDAGKGLFFASGIIRLRQTIAAAAVVFILLVSAFLLSKYGITQKTPVYSEFIVPYGSKSEITLPDGSSIWINAGSKVKYDNLFNIKNRQVYLTGEAYFEIENAKLPFVVNTQGICIRVLGTKFNVKAYPEEKTVETTVEKGMVEILNTLKGGTEAGKIILKSNQQALLSLKELRDEIKNNTMAEKSKAVGIQEQKTDAGQGLTINKKVKPEIYSSWKDAQWIIESEELQDLARKLERRYNVKIVFRDESLKKYVFSGVLKDETIEQVLEAMKLTAPVGYELKNNVVSLHEISVLKSRLNSAGK